MNENNEENNGGGKVLRESFAVLLVGLILIVVFVRSKHYGFALAAMPVMLIPVGHLLIRLVLYLTKGSFFGARPPMVIAFTDVLSLALSCVFVVLFSRVFQSRRNRGLYLVTLLAYNILLGWAYIYNALDGILL